MAGTGKHTEMPIRAVDFTAALDWWRGAGVDLDFADRPINWLEQADGKPAPLVEPVPSFAPPPLPDAPARAIIGGDPEGWPTDLAAFHAWWLAEASLDDGQVKNRVPPRGPAGAAIMIVVAQPEAGDAEGLLSGPEGRLLKAILEGMGIAAETTYVAAALPRHTPMADWAALAAGGLGAVMAHHVALVAPQRLIVFGSNILPLLGHDPAQSAKRLPVFYHQGGSLPLLGARELGALLARPSWKAGFWQHWLDWTVGVTGQGL